MSLRFLTSLHSCFKTRLLAQLLTRDLGRHNQLFTSFRKCEISSTAQGLAPKKHGTQQSLKAATSKRSQALISGSRKPAAYEPLTDKLALRASPTLLYRASPYANNFLFGCYAVGGGFLAAAWFNYQTQFYVRPGGVPPWVPRFTSVGSFLIGCVGVWMLLRPQNMVRAISCLPSSAKLGQGSRSLLLQIERIPILPFKQPRLVTVPPGDVTVSSHVFNDDAQQKLEATIAKINRRDERLRAFAKTSPRTLPFRQAEYWILRGFIGIRSSFTSGQFHYLHVRGNNRVWKLDKDPAWALDDGRAFDKLVKIKLG